MSWISGGWMKINVDSLRKLYTFKSIKENIFRSQGLDEEYKIILLMYFMGWGNLIILNDG